MEVEVVAVPFDRVLVVSVTGSGAGADVEGFFSSEVTMVDLGEDSAFGTLEALLLDLCSSLTRKEATLPETMTRSQRGKTFVMLYTFVKIVAQ